MKNSIMSLCIGLLLAFLTGCNATISPTSGPSLVDQSAAEATAIIQRAQATAMVLQAQAQATALVQSAGISAATPIAALTSVPTVNTNQIAVTPVIEQSTVVSTTDPTTVKLLNVGFGANGAEIVVNFTAQPSVTKKWGQGNLFVTDEATGAIYNSIPVVPILGQLLGRPRYMGQLGYVMFTNTPPGLHSGALVTVTLGNFKQEHVIVQ